jgi:hypothetical protein
MKLTLENVRLSFPALWKPKGFQGGGNTGTPKYSATLLLNKAEHKDQIDILRKAVSAVMMEKWPDKKNRGNIKICVREGAEKGDVEGYGADVIFVNASNDHKIPVVDRDRTPLQEGDPRPYAGCRVNAAIRLWAQDNQFGKRINAQLLGIQFTADDEAFGDKPFNPDEEFQDLSGGKQAPGQGGAAAAQPDEDEIPF